jgi:hypothetical protein
MAATQNNISASPVLASDYPKLDRKQAGHLRHFHNLVAQPDGEWHHFGSQEAQQEWDDAFRYQLATMCYAAGAAHYHRLPAMRTMFKTLMRRMIHKMLRREVWGYWFTTSHGGSLLDPDLKELRKPWADPVINENIMYSGHLLLMTSLYAMLFDDDEFERPGSLTFRWNPLFWGFKEDFVYDNRSLQEAIFKQMEANDWVGVCCEPNAIFVVCNQFPIIARRYNDVRDGTNVVSDVLQKYEAALKHKGMIGKDGLYASFFALKQGRAIPARQGAHTAWANAFMNSWNPEAVHALYDMQTMGFLTSFNGKTELHPTRIAKAFRDLVLEENADRNAPETLVAARQRAHKYVNPNFPYETISWGCFSMMLSELGKKRELADLLEYADRSLNPTWENGGLFYPRNDQLLDDDGHMIHIEPHSGNSGIGYSRLNVTDGQRKMWEQPWTRETLASQPWVDGLSLADGVDVLRGVWDEQKQAMVVTLKSWSSQSISVTLFIRNLPRKGQFAVYVNGEMAHTAAPDSSGSIEISQMVVKEELDIVVVPHTAAVL